MMSILPRGLHYRSIAAGAVLLTGIAVAGPARAQADRLVVADTFGGRAGWALETDDAFVLTSAGCMEMLTRIDHDGTVKPGLATSWTQTAATVWDFTLRAGVKFADGTPLDAGILSPNAFRGERINPVRACTGPFTIVEDVPRQMLRLERNPDYWGGAAGYARAELRVVPDGNVRATMVQTGEVAIARVLPVTELRQPPPNITVYATDIARITALYLNNARPPFNDVRVRQAVQAALDTTEIADSVYEGLARPAVGPFLPEAPWAPAGAAPVPRDLAKARALLAAAGVRPESLRIELLAYTERPELRDLASVVQAQLGELGIPVTIRIAAYASLEPALMAGEYQALLMSRNHLADVPDPGAFLAADYTCKGAFNLSQFCRPEIDAKVAEAVGTADASRRFALYAEVAAQLQRDAVSVFVVREQQRDAVSNSVRGFRMHPFNHYLITRDLSPAR